MDANIPYTYLIGWSSLGKYYYGCQYGKKANPNNLWKTYFTSSKYVKEYVDLYGIPDVIQIRKTFSCPVDARNHEEKVLRRMKCQSSDMWLNKSNNGSFKNVVMDDHIRESISKAKKGKSITLPPVKDSTRHLMSENRKGVSVKDRISPDKYDAYMDGLRQRQKGKSKPDGFGEKVSKALKGKVTWITNGELNRRVYVFDIPQAGWRYGFTTSPEARKKISESKRRNKDASTEK